MLTKRDLILALESVPNHTPIYILGAGGGPDNIVLDESDEVCILTAIGDREILDVKLTDKLLWNRRDGLVVR